jgi:hypothetical protein
MNSTMFRLLVSLCEVEGGLVPEERLTHKALMVQGLEARLTLESRIEVP